MKLIVKFDTKRLNNQNFQLITQFSQILANDGELEVGSFTLGIFEITINKIETYEMDLIK